MLNNRLTVEKLIYLLRVLPLNYKIQTNTIGNLSIINKNDEYCGFIDFKTEEIDLLGKVNAT